MRTTQSPPIDFNQMLVVSVFFHFFLFAVVMFLPQTQDTVKRIIPTFTVNFVDVPTGPDIEPAPPAPKVEKQPVAPMPPKTPVAKKPVPPEPKPIPKPKPIQKSKPIPPKPIPKPKPIQKSKPIPPKPKPVPEKSAAAKALVSKLDELARLQKKKAIRKKKKPAVVPPKPKENVLKDFENMKMKTATEKKPTRKKIAKDELALKELEFEHLSKKSANTQSREKKKKKSNLFKELDELEQMNKQAHAALTKPKVRKTDSKANELVKRLEAIKNENVQIKIDTSKLTSRHTQKFKSGIRNLKMADIQKRAAAPTASGEMGDPGSNALSKYVGEVYVKIMKNWKDPLGGGDGQVQVSFSIFPRGNIATPKILKTSGDPKLDILAVRAIKNAVPLPPFPKEIKEPNLPLILNFDYVPTKN